MVQSAISSPPEVGWYWSGYFSTYSEVEYDYFFQLSYERQYATLVQTLVLLSMVYKGH